MMSRFQEYLEAGNKKEDQVEYLMRYINIELDHELSIDRSTVEKLKTNIKKVLQKHL